MKNTVLRHLLLSAACVAILSGCDNADNADTQSRPDEHAGNMMNYTQIGTPEPTWAGSYLAARFAQQRFDWPRAESFLNQVEKEKPGNDTISRRMMLLSMGSGDFSGALEQAKNMPTADESGLSDFILLLADIRDGQYTTARHALDRLPQSPIVIFARPLFQVWLDAANNKIDFSPLSGQPSYFYQRVLLADFTNHMELVDSRHELGRALNQMPAIAIERVGDIYMRHGKYDLAADAYRAVITLAPGAPNIIAKRDSAEKGAPLPDTIPTTAKIKDAREGTATVLFELATTFYNEQSFETAQLFAQMALTLKPDYDDTRLLVANLMARNDRIDDAIRLYQQIPDTNPRYTQIQQQVAQLLVSNKRDDEAIATLNHLLATTTKKEDKISYLMQIGDITRENEDYKAALSNYNQVFALLDNKIDEENWEVLYARGMTLERLKRWADAEKDLTEALKFRPDHPYLLNYLGYSWADQNIKLDQAVDLLLKAVRIVPQDGYVTDSVGWVYYRMGKYDKAVEYLERAVELMPYDPTINDHLGDAYAKSHRMREAKFQWQRAYNYSEEEDQRTQIGAKLSGVATATSLK